VEDLQMAAHSVAETGGARMLAGGCLVAGIFVQQAFNSEPPPWTTKG
jgi:hypothetical protein